MLKAHIENDSKVDHFLSENILSHNLVIAIFDSRLIDVNDTDKALYGHVLNMATEYQETLLPSPHPVEVRQVSAICPRESSSI